MVRSDPQDWAVWQANHDNWTNLINAEMEHRAGRTPGWYRELLGMIDKDDLDLGKGVTRGSSTSNLSDTGAFERGYRGGWR
jgi:hypothetical protein